MSKPGKNLPPKDFESALAEMERLVAGMEAADLPLEAALAAYRRGVELAAYCQKTLAEAESQVRILEDGQLRDFDPDAADPRDDD